MAEAQHHSAEVSIILKNQLQAELSTGTLRVSSTATMEDLCSLLNSILSKHSRYLLYLNGERINTDASRELLDVVAAQNLTTEKVLEILYIDEDDIVPENTLSCCDTVVSVVSVEDRIIYMTYMGGVYEIGKERQIYSLNGHDAGIFADKKLYAFDGTTVQDESGSPVFEAGERIRCCSAYGDWIAVGCLNTVHLLNLAEGTTSTIELKSDTNAPHPCIRGIQVNSSAVAWIQGYDTIQVHLIADGSRRECKAGLSLTTLRLSGNEIVCLTANNKIIRFDITSGEMEKLDTALRHMNVLQLDGPTAICGAQDCIVYESFGTGKMTDGRIIPVKGQVNDFVVAHGLIYVAHENFISTYLH